MHKLRLDDMHADDVAWLLRYAHCPRAALVAYKALQLRYIWTGRYWLRCSHG